MDILGTALRMVVSLGVVLGLMGVLLYLLRRSPLAVRFGQSQRDLIQVLSRCPLSQRESLCLVRVGKEMVLLGLSGSQITLLLRLADGHQTPDAKHQTSDPEASPLPLDGGGSW